MYRNWPQSFPDTFDVQPVQLPGREHLFAEPLSTCWLDLVQKLGAGLRANIDKPFVLFGHSMGAFLAAEIAAWLERQDAPRPALLVVSGHAGNWFGQCDEPGRQYSDEEVLRGAGVDERALDALAEPELRDIVLDVLRADYALCAGYAPSFRQLATPILALGGTEDPLLPIDRVELWARRTTGSFRFRAFNGGHFFLRDHVAGIVEEIVQHPAMESG
jgi:surfactin synthase thioesterase subunit